MHVSAGGNSRRMLKRPVACEFENTLGVAHHTSLLLRISTYVYVVYWPCAPLGGMYGQSQGREIVKVHTLYGVVYTDRSLHYPPGIVRTFLLRGHQAAPASARNGLAATTQAETLLSRTVLAGVG